MKRLILILASALAAVPAVASASEESYMHPGQIEAGGLIGIISQTQTYKPDGGDETKTTVTGIAIQPEVTYFVADGFGLIGRLDVLNFSQKFEDEDPTTQTIIGLGVGAGYYVNAGIARVGPQAILKFRQQTIKIPNVDFGAGPDDLDITQTDTGAEVGVLAKVPVGNGGVIAAGLVVDYANVAQKIEYATLEAEPTGTVTNIGARVGYFVTF